MVDAVYAKSSALIATTIVGPVVTQPTFGRLQICELDIVFNSHYLIILFTTTFNTNQSIRTKFIYKTWHIKYFTKSFNIHYIIIRKLYLINYS